MRIYTRPHEGFHFCMIADYMLYGVGNHTGSTDNLVDTACPVFPCITGRTTDGGQAKEKKQNRNSYLFHKI